MHRCISCDMHLCIVRTTIDLSDQLLARVKKLMHERKTTLRALVEEGLQRILDEERTRTPFKLRDASFRGEAGFVEGAGAEDIARVLHELNEGRGLP